MPDNTLKILIEANYTPSPTLGKLEQELQAITKASEAAHKQLGIAFTDFIGIKAAADSAAQAVQSLSAAMRGLPSHLPPYGQTQPAPSTAQPRATGGAFETGGAYFINEDPRSRPEVIVQNPSGGGYVLTKQDAQQALNTGPGHTFNFYPSTDLDIEFVARRVVELMRGA